MADEISLPRFEMRPLSEEEGEGYLIEFLDFPGCIADGETPDEAMREGADALKSYRSSTQALTSDRTRSISGKRRFKHCRNRTLNSHSDMFNQLPCLGV